jgi:D-xylose transport system substrate-binding protein
MKLFTTPRRRFYSLISLLLLSVMIVACGNGNNTNPGSTTGSTSNTAPVNGKGCKKVGILLPESASSPRWETYDHPALVSAIQAVTGVAPDYANAQGDSSLQLTQAEADLSKGDCILVVAPHDSTQAAAIVAAAKAKNVPVIAYDRLIQSKDLTAYVTFDNVQVGVLQGQYIADNYTKYVSSGHNNLVMIDGAKTDNNALLFAQGAHSIIDPLVKAGKLNNVYEQFTPNWDNATAQVEMEAALTKTQDNVQIAYVANDGMANNVIAALKAKNLAGKVLVTGQDASISGIHYILLGYQNMTVYKKNSLEAQATADVVQALMNGTDLTTLSSAGKVTTTATTDGGNVTTILETPVIVDASNVASTVIADGYVTKDQVCQGVPAGTDGVC